MHKLKLFSLFTASALLFCTLMSGCSERRGDSSEYNIYSGGSYISDGNDYISSSSEYTYADFYVPEGMVTDYYRKNILNEKERDIYETTLKNLGKLKETVPLTVDSSDYQKVLDTIRLEQLAFTHVSGRALDYNTSSKEFEISFTYRLTADEISSMNIASEKAAKEIISQLTPDMDDYEKLKFFHDYLILNCETDTEYKYADTIYGALVEKKALCEGYSKAFSYLCNLAGIENVIVTGQTYVAHMWNMVKLSGNWYHVDVTWDKPDDELHKMFPDVVLYQYFMVTDSVITNNHIIWTYPCEPPKAYGTAENYFVRNGTDISAKDELLTAAENAIVSAVKSGKTSAMIKFNTSDLYISSLSTLSNEETFNLIIEKIRLEYGKKINLSWTDFYGQYRIITFIITYEDVKLYSLS